MQTKTYNKLDINIIMSYINTGKTYKEIAEIFSTSASSIGRFVRFHNIHLRGVQSEDTTKAIIAEYCNGFSITNIAKRYHFSSSTISRLLKENNIVIKKSEAYNTKYTLNQNYFDNIDSEDKDYILGLLCADGCVSHNTISISLQEGDQHILNDINTRIESNRPLRCIPLHSKNKNWHNQYCLTIVNKHMATSLKLLGVIENKSHNLQFPNIDPCLYSHFIRGYFDGDGCIIKTEKRASLVGTHPFLSTIKNILEEELSIHFSLRQCRSKSVTYELRVSGSHQTKVFLDYIYHQSTIQLNRKYQLYCIMYC